MKRLRTTGLKNRGKEREKMLNCSVGFMKKFSLQVLVGYFGFLLLVSSLASQRNRRGRRVG